MVAAVLADYRTAPISEKLRATLALIEKLTLRPAEVGPEDMAPLRAAGLSDEEIEDAIQVCSIFNVINRIADAFEFRIPPQSGYAAGARMLVDRGYK